MLRHGPVMRIATITNWAYATTVCLTIAAGITMVLASSADQVERAAVKQRDVFDELTFEVEDDISQLSDRARLFAISADPAHAAVYQQTLAGLGSVEKRVSKLRDNGAGAEELQALHEGLHLAKGLEEEQQAAMAAKIAGDGDRARALVFGPEYERELERVRSRLGHFRYVLDQRSDRAIEDASFASQRLRTVSEIMVAITAILFLFVLGFILKHRILRPVVTLSDVINRLADQDYAVETPLFSQVDEIGDMAQAIRIFRENGLVRQKLERQRDADWQVREMLARMTQRLQGCESVSDLFTVVRLFAPVIAPDLAGRLYILDSRIDLMVCAAEWQGPRGTDAAFGPDGCWALRRGQIHSPGGEMVDVPCGHVASEATQATICVPLTAQGETIGLLVLENLVAAREPDASTSAYIELMSETVGLALANLNLREALHEKALFDSLTGLRNRHDLDEKLRKLVLGAEASGLPLGCLMMDIDRFKSLNDRFGHDAGDFVIRAVAGVFGSVMRDEGLAFRYGGEEFLMLMPGFDEQQAMARAALIKERIGELELVHEGTALGPVTVSIGLAVHPWHGPAQSLILTADAALLRAKEEGRDRIVVASRRQRNAA